MLRATGRNPVEHPGRRSKPARVIGNDKQARTFLENGVPQACIRRRPGHKPPLASEGVFERAGWQPAQ
eukprot:14567417-Alexandrium_andersonii.AAC.1